MASRPRCSVPRAAVALLLVASLAACAQADDTGGVASPSPAPSAAASTPSSSPLVVAAPAPTQPEAKALSPLPTVRQ